MDTFDDKCVNFYTNDWQAFQKTHVTWSLCSGKDNADDLPQDTQHVDVRIRTRRHPFTPHLIKYLIPPDILKMQRTRVGC